MAAENPPTGSAGIPRAFDLRAVLQQWGYVSTACSAGTLAAEKPPEWGEREGRSETPGLVVEAGIVLQTPKALVHIHQLCTSVGNLQANPWPGWNAPAETWGKQDLDKSSMDQGVSDTDRRAAGRHGLMLLSEPASPAGSDLARTDAQTGTARAQTSRRRNPCAGRPCTHRPVCGSAPLGSPTAELRKAAPLASPQPPVLVFLKFFMPTRKERPSVLPR